MFLPLVTGRRQATLRILPVSALDGGEVKNVVIEISETKGIFVMKQIYVSTIVYMYVRVFTCTVIYLFSILMTVYARNVLCTYLSVGAHIFCTGNLGPTNYVCVAVKNKILIYEINRSKQHYEQKKV